MNRLGAARKNMSKLMFKLNQRISNAIDKSGKTIEDLPEHLTERLSSKPLKN